MSDIKKIMDEIEYRLKICSICDSYADMSECNPENCANNAGFKLALEKYRELKGDG